MTKPKTITQVGWKLSATELAVLFALTTFAGVQLLNMQWLVAAAAAPFVMFAALAGLMLLVEALWVVVTGAERIGQVCGLRKSPLL